MMKLFAFLGSLFGAFVRALFFKSNDERLGASEERAKTLEKQIEVKKAMDDAPKAKTRADILDILDKGKLAVLIGLFFLTACACPPPAIVCQNTIDWTPQQNASIAADIRKLPESSLVPLVIADYHNMRQEADACRAKLGGK